MRPVFTLLVVGAMLLVGAALLRNLPKHLLVTAPQQPTTVVSQGPTLEQLERLSQLATTRVHLADVLVGETAHSRGAWLIRGDALLGVDLARARIVERDEATRQATLLLPPPQVLEARVDHERTRTWEVRQTTWIPWRSDQDQLRDRVMREAQELITHAAGTTENLAHARSVAEAFLRDSYQRLGWQVVIRWEAAPELPTPPSSP